METQGYKAVPMSEWADLGACYGKDSEQFFTKNMYPKAARALCKACDVRQICLEYAVVNGERGLWGDTTEGDRRVIRRQLGIREENTAEIAAKEPAESGVAESAPQDTVFGSYGAGDLALSD